mmetsp:Transcript_4623/g.8002  ORF Transcript_4623/g.8002 Transcript_4623/m.8002 type:complete len:88 (+) Transcript_4623:67-330(+)
MLMTLGMYLYHSVTVTTTELHESGVATTVIAGRRAGRQGWDLLRSRNRCGSVSVGRQWSQAVVCVFAQAAAGSETSRTRGTLRAQAL